MPTDKFQNLEPGFPRTKNDYFGLSRSRQLPPRCPYLKHCQRRQLSIELFSRMEGTTSESPKLERPIIEAVTKPYNMGDAHSASFFIKNLCPEVPLFESEYVFGGLGGHPIITVSYDKHFSGDEKFLVSETGHFSDCAEYGTAAFQSSPLSTPQPTARTSPSTMQEAIDTLEHIARRFPMVVERLKIRRQGNDAVLIRNEYDVQYVFQSLMALYFDDIRPEETTGSTANHSSRIDCLLPRLSVGVEFKMLRQASGATSLKGELAVDFLSYPKHPDCKAIFVFVYDPHKTIQNPRGVEHDLSNESRMPGPIRVSIVP